MLNDHKWRESLKPGDRVFIRGCGFHSEITESTVSKVTKTQIVLSNGSRFLIRNGRKVGSSLWSSTYIEEPTQAAVDEVNERRARIKCKVLLRNARVPEGIEEVKELTVVLERLADKREL